MYSRAKGEGEASPLADWSGVTGVMEATKNGRFGRRVKAVFFAGVTAPCALAP
jgi:hypothetical protein